MKPVLLILLPSAGVMAGWFLRPILQPASPAILPGGPEAVAAAEDGGRTAAGHGKTGQAGPVAVVKAGALPPLDLSNPQAVIKSLLKFSRSAENPLRRQARLLAFADQLGPADLKALALEASNQPGNYWGGDDSVKSILLGRWAETAPAEALAYVTQNNTPQSREALRAVFSQLAVTDPKRAEAALAALGGDRRKGALQAMAGRMASTDPMGALAMLTRQKSSPGDFAFYTVMDTWVRQDAASAAAYAGSLNDGPQRRQALDNIANGMAQQDPAAALAWAKALPKASESMNMVRSMIGQVAGRDPQAALAMTQAQPLREQRQLLSGVAANWIRHDSEGAIAWIRTMDDSATRQDCLSNMAYQAAWNGVESLKEVMELLPKGQARRTTLENISGSLGWSDPDAALAWAKTLPQEDRDLVIGRLSGSAAESDPVAAAAMAAALPPSAESVGALTNIASIWAGKDPEAALAWAATLESDKARQDATSAALTQWADRDPEKAAGATAQITDANARRTARDRIAAVWAQKSPAEAEKWAAALPPEDRFSALSGVFNATAADDPRKAAAGLAALMPEAAGIDAAAASLTTSASTVATAWVSQDPAAAAHWAVTLPEGKARDAAMAAVADQWAGTDTLAASTWINTLPAGRSRDEAAAKLIEKITPTDPAAAFTWAADIQDPDRQLQSLKSTINAWKVYNPAAVREALGSANLDEATMGKLNAELK